MVNHHRFLVYNWKDYLLMQFHNTFCILQPCLNPEDSQSKDYVFLNRWAGRTCSYKHGDVVSLK